MNRELISPEGLRMDGRRAGELRKIKCELGVFEKVDGSAVYDQGNTQVVATVIGPQECASKSRALFDRAILNCEVTTSSFALNERKQQTRDSKQHKEAALLIKQTFESVILLDLFPNSEINIHVQVIQSDGGVTAASINAVTLALVNAGVPMREFVVASSAGFAEGLPFLDLNSTERSVSGAVLTVAIEPNSGKVALMTLEARLASELIDPVLLLAVEGCKVTADILRAKVREHAVQVAGSSQ